MPDEAYKKLQALIVDDFESFRITLTRMLQDFGIGTVDSVPTSSEALRYCASKVYDVILCDQNLGKGKTGQQVLEVLRHTENRNSDSLFVLVSAESNKSIIMAAYDYEPDAYLTKPITAQTLGQRLERLFAQRIALAPIYKALKEKRLDDAVALCETEISLGQRYSGFCQKTLGKLLLQQGKSIEAENLYRRILDVRQLDWAMLGMAQTKKIQGDTLSAQQWLEEIIQFNPLCLKAYDLLAELLSERGDTLEQQKTIQQAVDISPLSVLRQQALGEIAFKNNDIAIAANAFRKAIKLGENSCHDRIEVHENFVRSSIQLARFDKNIAKTILRESLKVVSEMPNNFGKSDEICIQSALLETQVLRANGDEKRSNELLQATQKLISSVDERLPIEIKIEYAKTLREQGRKDECDKLVKELLEKYENDEDELQKIDCLLEEPCSAKNKALVAKINKEGIAFYEAKDFNRAVWCFTSALQDFPQHIGLRLNLVQALMGQSKQYPDKPQIITTIQQTMEYVGEIIPQNHAQFRRFRQLEDVLRELTQVKLSN